MSTKGEKIVSNSKLSTQFTKTLLQQVYKKVLSDITKIILTEPFSILQNKTLLGPKI